MVTLLEVEVRTTGMLRLVCSLLMAHALCVSALPSIFQPTTENSGLDSATISWSPRGDTSGNYKYVVKIKEYKDLLNPNAKTDRHEFEKSITKTPILGLKSGTSYGASVTAVSEDGAKTGSESVYTIFTTDGIPPPTKIKITKITATSVTFEWTPPADTEIDGTLIRIKQTDTRKFQSFEEQSSSTYEYTITELEPNSPYVIHLKVRKGDIFSTELTGGFRTGLGSISRITMSDLSSTGAVAHWNQPIASSDYRISRYQVALMENASSTSAEGETRFFFTPADQPSHLKYTFNDLLPARIYGVKVRSVYKTQGYGDWSQITFFESKAQVQPSTPTNPEIKSITKISFEFSWNPPKYTKDIIDYEIQYAKKNERPEPIVHTHRSDAFFVITGLESGTDYLAKVRAIGKNNLQGAWSVERHFTTRGPKPVSSISITEIVDKSAKVSWTTYTGETPDKFYVYYKERDSSWKKNEVDGKTFSYTMTSLQPFTFYEVKVTVWKNKDESSEKLNELTTNFNIDLIATQPTALSLKILTKTTIEISFKKVPNHVVKLYEVEIRGFTNPNIPFTKILAWTPTKALGIQTGNYNKMESGWKYQIRARAIFSSDIEGQWSTPVGIELPGVRPVRVIDVSDITDTDCTVSWKSGYEVEDTKPHLIQYIIQLYSVTGKTNEENLIAEYRASKDETEHRFVGKLKESNGYKAYIATQGQPEGSTDFETSTKKQIGFASASAPPKAPVFSDIKINADTVTAYWVAIPGRHDIMHYDVHISQLGVSYISGGEKYQTLNGQETTFTFTNLPKGHFYEIRVRGVASQKLRSDVILGKWMIQTFYLEDKKIKKVEDTKIMKMTSTSVTLAWQIGDRPDLKMYEIELKNKERGLTQIIKTKTLTNNFKVNDLHKGTTYTYRVRAATLNQKGPWSEPKTFKTVPGSGLFGTGMSTGETVGIALAVIAIIIIIVIIVIVYRKKRRGQPFERFDSSVKFEKNGRIDKGGDTVQEMDETATAIRNGKKLYI